MRESVTSHSHCSDEIPLLPLVVLLFLLKHAKINSIEPPLQNQKIYTILAGMSVHIS